LEVTVNVYLAHLPRGPRGAAVNERPQVGPQIKLQAPESWRIEAWRPEPEPQPAGPSPFPRGRERASASSRFRVTVPEDEPPTQAYWLSRERTRDQFDWDAQMPRNLPFAPPRLTAQVEVWLDGERVTVTQPVEYRFADKTIGELRRELKVAPPLTLAVRPALLVIPLESKNRAREVSVEVTHNARRSTSGTVSLIAPPGWRVETGGQPLAFTRQGERASRRFRVLPPPGAHGTFQLKAAAEAGGRQYASGYTAVAYPHIETHFVYTAAAAKAELFEVKVAPGLSVGSVMGSGDEVPEALAQLGVQVKLLGEADLSSGHLQAYDVIILGIRAYEVRDDLIATSERLLDYVARGGTLIVQYNKLEFERGNFAPFPVRMDGRLRVTDEAAPVKVLAPEHPLFNFPNKITEADWKGWVQERGLYFLSEWDARYQPLLSAPDEGGRELQGGELIAPLGKGYYLFTAYAWFRQLPAGVPGAYRLFANMISLPKRK
jgi:hypothetical protein